MHTASRMSPVLDQHLCCPHQVLRGIQPYARLQLMHQNLPSLCPTSPRTALLTGMTEQPHVFGQHRSEHTHSPPPEHAVAPWNGFVKDSCLQQAPKISWEILMAWKVSFKFQEQT